MKMLTIDDIDIVINEIYSEPTHASVLDSEAMFTYAGQSVTIPCNGKSVAMLTLKNYLAVLVEKGTSNKYALADGNKTRYSNGRLPFMSLKGALSWKNAFLYSPGFKNMRSKYDFYAIMLWCEKTNEWLKSYMPSKRRKITQEQREQVYAKCDGHCAYCGKPISIKEMQVDHVDSHYRHQGKDEVDNYLPACRDCNGLKSDYLLEEFRCVLIPNCAKRRGLGDTRSARISRAYGLNANPKKKITFYFEKEKGNEGNE